MVDAAASRWGWAGNRPGCGAALGGFGALSLRVTHLRPSAIPIAHREAGMPNVIQCDLKKQVKLAELVLT